MRGQQSPPRMEEEVHAELRHLLVGGSQIAGVHGGTADVGVDQRAAKSEPGACVLENVDGGRSVLPGNGGQADEAGMAPLGGRALLVDGDREVPGLPERKEVDVAERSGA